MESLFLLTKKSKFAEVVLKDSSKELFVVSLNCFLRLTKGSNSLKCSLVI